jgi:hypothetical protein
MVAARGVFRTCGRRHPLTAGRGVRPALTFGLAAALALGGCRPNAAPSGNGVRVLDAAYAAALQDSVRAFAASVAQGVTAHGPAAWRAYFAEQPTFFMASEGRLVFPNSDSATRAIEGLTHVLKHLDLRWGDSLRVDPLAPGLALLATPYHEVQVDARGRRVEEEGFFTGIAEHYADGWRFRNAHWSVVPPSALP